MAKFVIEHIQNTLKKYQEQSNVDKDQPNWLLCYEITYHVLQSPILNVHHECPKISN